jgi:hypothetical protein
MDQENQHRRKLEDYAQIEKILQIYFEGSPSRFQDNMRFALQVNFQFLAVDIDDRYRGEKILVNALNRVLTGREDQNIEHFLRMPEGEREFILYELPYEEEGSVFLLPLPDGMYCCYRREDGFLHGQYVSTKEEGLTEEEQKMIAAAKEFFKTPGM